MLTSSGADEVDGVVRWYDPNRGYGFVASNVHGDVFLHWRNLKEEDRAIRWPAGTKIRFKVRLNSRTKKPEAYEARTERH